jgi:hypothetical protein
MVDLTPRLATTIEQATVALQDFEQPLESGDPRYVDLSPARGDDARHAIRTQLLRKQGGRPLHIVFTSHRGAGKSTELKRLMHEVRKNYHTIYVEANVELDPVGFDLEDLLLVLARSVCEEMDRVKLPLPEELLKRVTEWFSSTVETTAVGRTYVAELKSSAKVGGSWSFLRLMTNLTALGRLESSHRTEVKDVLRKYPGSLMKAVNSLFEGAHRLLKESHNRELLIIIDNLDRYPPEVVERLLVSQVDRFAELACNLILTPPISLLYRPGGGRLSDLFQHEVMCAVRMRGEKDPYDQPHGDGYRLLLNALGQRIDLDRLLPDEAARRRLVVASGGSVRDLLKLASDASLRIDEGPITLSAVSRVVDQHRARMRDEVRSNKGWLESLRNIAATKCVSDADADLAVLHHRLAFKYNGSYWYDIHPLLAEVDGILAPPPVPGFG